MSESVILERLDWTSQSASRMTMKKSSSIRRSERVCVRGRNAGTMISHMQDEQWAASSHAWCERSHTDFFDRTSTAWLSRELEETETVNISVPVTCQHTWPYIFQVGLELGFRKGGPSPASLSSLEDNYIPPPSLSLRHGDASSAWANDSGSISHGVETDDI